MALLTSSPDLNVIKLSLPTVISTASSMFSGTDWIHCRREKLSLVRAQHDDGIDGILIVDSTNESELLQRNLKIEIATKLERFSANL
jgi:hypothetical protein